MSYRKFIAWSLGMLCSVFFQQKACCNGNPTQRADPVSFETIADFNSVKEVETWARRNGLPIWNQTREEMVVQHSPSGAEAAQFGAVGMMTLALHLRNNSITVYIQLFYAKTGAILGRMLLIENRYE